MPVHASASLAIGQPRPDHMLKRWTKGKRELLALTEVSVKPALLCPRILLAIGRSKVATRIETTNRYPDPIAPEVIIVARLNIHYAPISLKQIKIP